MEGLDCKRLQQNLSEKGYVIIEDIFTTTAIEEIINQTQYADSTKATFRKTKDLFAIRQFFREVPQVVGLLFTDKLKTTIQDLFGNSYFVVKSIYFGKPGTSNWFVSYHQDLTTSVDKKIEKEGFGPWSVKQNNMLFSPHWNYWRATLLSGFI